MSDDEDDYEYEYDDDDDGDQDDNMEEDNNNQFQYTDDEEEPDDVVVALENSYYNAKGLRESSVHDATMALEQVITQEQEQLQTQQQQQQQQQQQHEGTTTQQRYGIWSYKALKQLVKLHLRVAAAATTTTTSQNDVSLDQLTIMKYYTRLLECISTAAGTEISPALIEKGINTMLERVASLNHNRSCSSATSTGKTTDNYTPSTLALAIYDATLIVFHPQTGTCKIERLWFKTNLKYGQLLYEMNETTKLQLVLQDLIHIHGEPDMVISNRMNYDDTNNNSSVSTGSGAASVSTNSLEIYALQIQLYSRLKDNKKLRTTFHKALNVRGGIPHPRTIALIQELGGKMYMSNNEYEEASKTFFQAFKSYDEAGDKSRLRCLKYLVLASMLHASQINPFDSQEARPYRDDPEIVAMTNLVKAFHNNDIQNFEKILYPTTNNQTGQNSIMDDEFIREHIEELLRTIRIQVLRRYIRPYQRISLDAIAAALNDISINEVESLLTHLILDGKLDGLINRTTNTLMKRIEYGGGDSSAAATTTTTTTMTGNTTNNSTSTMPLSTTTNVSSSSSGGGGNPSNQMTMTSSGNNNNNITTITNTTNTTLMVQSPTIMKCKAMEEMIQILENISRHNTSSVNI